MRLIEKGSRVAAKRNALGHGAVRCDGRRAGASNPNWSANREKNAHGTHYGKSTIGMPEAARRPSLSRASP
jgi:hypothetical protein